MLSIVLLLNYLFLSFGSDVNIIIASKRKGCLLGNPPPMTTIMI